jgi:hypothetical protein
MLKVVPCSCLKHCGNIKLSKLLHNIRLEQAGGQNLERKEKPGTSASGSTTVLIYSTSPSPSPKRRLSFIGGSLPTVKVEENSSPLKLEEEVSLNL